MKISMLGCGVEDEVVKEVRIVADVMSVALCRFGCVTKEGCLRSARCVEARVRVRGCECSA